MKHLWEMEHPYYWNEGAFFKNGYHTECECWAEFVAMMGEADDDLNLLCRWDWKLETTDATAETSVEPVGTGTLKLRYVIQRKGHCLSFDVRVTPADEPAVREFLQKKWAHMQTLWAPFSESRTP